jgi:hypothetical protein
MDRIANTVLHSNGPTVPLLLLWRGVYHAIAQQQLSLLAPVFWPSAIMSQYICILMKLLLIFCIGIGQSTCGFYIEHKFKGFCKLLYNMIDPT